MFFVMFGQLSLCTYKRFVSLSRLRYVNKGLTKTSQPVNYLAAAFYKSVKFNCTGPRRRTEKISFRCRCCSDERNFGGNEKKSGPKKVDE